MIRINFEVDFFNLRSLGIKLKILNIKIGKNYIRHTKLGEDFKVCETSALKVINSSTLIVDRPTICG